MSDRSVIVAVVVSLGIVVAAAFISSGMKSVAAGVRDAGSSIGQGLANSAQLRPRELSVKISDAGNPIRIDAGQK